MPNTRLATLRADAKHCKRYDELKRLAEFTFCVNDITQGRVDFTFPLPSELESGARPVDWHYCDEFAPIVLETNIPSHIAAELRRLAAQLNADADKLEAELIEGGDA